MEPEAQPEAAPESTEVAQHEPVHMDDQVEQVPESYNIFSEEQGPVPSEGNRAEPVAEQKKSKQFLENVRKDKQLRHQEISLKQRHEQISHREQELNALSQSQKHLRDNPNEFFKSQGIDPMEYYRTWTERLINTDGEPSLETQLQKTNHDLEQLRGKISNREEQEQQAAASSKQNAAYSSLCGQVEQYAVKSDGYETIKETCTARDVVNGMVEHFKATGEELTIEEAFEKIETGLREREESFYRDPKIVAKLQRYNPSASRTARGPQATLSAKWKEQPTRTDPNDMPYEEIRDYWKGKLFT